MDPRYPRLPSKTICLPEFQQPQRWADYFGARARTYFVPQQTGIYYFMLSSDAGSELYLSTNEKPDSKSKISHIDGGFATYPFEFDRYSGQISLPISLEKGKYYYMETIMKDDHQNDHLEVGMQAPNGTNYTVIPSTFLRTSLPVPPNNNFSYQAILLKVAAEAGAKAGLSFGERWAKKTGAKAGAKAGAMAGVQAGAWAGGTAGENAAIRMITKTLEDGLNNLHGNDGHKYKINVVDGNVVSVTGPGMTGASAAAGAAANAWAGGTVGIGGSGGAGGSAGSAGKGGTAGATGSAGATAAAGSAGAAAGASGGAGGAGGSGGAVGAGATGNTGTGSSSSGGAAAGGAAAAGGGGSQVSGSASVGVGTGSAGTGGASSGTMKPAKWTYIPKPGEDPQLMALNLVWKAGGARKIVANGMYTFHSMEAPFMQEDAFLNDCWRSKYGLFYVDKFCQVFITRIPALSKEASTSRDTVSFESACRPGYFLRQKNYHFILQKRDGTELFDKDSSFFVYDVVRYTRNFLFNSMHKDWYVCDESRGEDRRVHKISKLALDFYSGNPDVLPRCAFILNPIEKNGDKFRNCKNFIGPVETPEISGQPLPHPPHLVSNKPPSPFGLPTCIPVCPAGPTQPGAQAGQGSMGQAGPGTSAAGASSSHGVQPSTAVQPSYKPYCVAVIFDNKVGSPFTLYSSLKHEGYLVAGSGFKLKLLIDRPELHSHVTFYAKDPGGNRGDLLNGEPSISRPVVSNCDYFFPVTVTAEQGSSSSPPGAPVTSPPSSVPGQYAPPAAPPAPAAPPLPPPPPPAAPLPALPPAPAYPAPPSQPPLAPPSPPAPSTAPAPQPAYAPHSPSIQGAPSMPRDNGSVHYHYHYYKSKTADHLHACPSSCSPNSVPCLPACPIHCCKRDWDEYVKDEGDEDQTTEK